MKSELDKLVMTVAADWGINPFEPGSLKDHARVLQENDYPFYGLSVFAADFIERWHPKLNKGDLAMYMQYARNYENAKCYLWDGSEVKTMTPNEFFLWLYGKERDEFYGKA